VYVSIFLDAKHLYEPLMSFCLYVCLYVCMSPFFENFWFTRSRTLLNSAQHLHNICTNPAQTQHKICTKSAQNYTKYAQNMHKRCTKCSQILHKICIKSAQILHKFCTNSAHTLLAFIFQLLQRGPQFFIFHIFILYDYVSNNTKILLFLLVICFNLGLHHFHQPSIFWHTNVPRKTKLFVLSEFMGYN
jgi:hypothetical protein